MKYNFVDSANRWLPGEDIPSMIQHFKNPVGIEIGTDAGTTTTYLLETIGDLTLHGVDPYTPYTDWGGNPCTGWHDAKVSDGDESYRLFMEKVAPYGDRYIHHRKTSDDALADFEDESLDFIFIDGLHTYKQVLIDCKNYYPKLKKGGMFCGHDFTNIKEVNQAVMEFAREARVPQIKVIRQDVWSWFK